MFAISQEVGTVELNHDHLYDLVEPKIRGARHNAGKTRHELQPFDAIDAISEIWTQGAAEYGDRNWELGMPWTEVLGSLLRHVFDWAMGQDYDKKSGKLNLAHAGCNILMLLSYQLRKIGTDNRPKY